MTTPTAEQIRLAQEAGNAAYAHAEEIEMALPLCVVEYRAAYDDTLAALIAAAPELLEALKAMVEEIEIAGYQNCNAAKQARTAITKAEETK